MKLLPFEVVKTTSQLRTENSTDLPCVKSFGVELDLWQNKWMGDSQLGYELNTPEKVLGHTDYDYFPNIIVIVATLPVTSCKCERSISMLKRLVSTVL